jgi:putative membrane protein
MNCILKPILVLFALPFIIFTMGIGILFINALIIYVSASLIPEGIEVASYWSALWASFWVSVLWWSVEMFRSERIVVFKERVSGVKDNNDNDTPVLQK